MDRSRSVHAPSPERAGLVGRSGRGRAAIRRLVTASALIAVAACSDGDVAVYVDLRTDFAWPREFTTTRTEVSPSRPGRFPSADARPYRVTARDDLVIGTRIAEVPVSPGAQWIRVTLLRDDRTEVVSRVLEVTVETARVVPVVITRDCFGLACPGRGDPPTATECLGGACVLPTCLSGSDVGCPAAECSRDSECAALPCATPRCVQGVCLAVEDPACADAGLPDAAPLDGPEPDAGIPDPPPLDAGMDGGSIDGRIEDTGPPDAGPLDTGIDAGPLPVSCEAILDLDEAAASGRYRIASPPDSDGGVATAFDVYCDMATEDGGWTLVAYAGSANNWSHSSALWLELTEVGALPSDPTTHEGDYRSPAYGLLASTEFLLKTFDRSSTGLPTSIVWTFPAAKSAHALLSDTPTRAEVRLAEGGATPIFPPTLATFGSQNCHHYAGGIPSRICMYRVLDWNSAHYPHWGADYGTYGTGDFYYHSSWAFTDVNGASNLGTCANAVCDSYSWSLWAR